MNTEQYFKHEFQAYPEQFRNLMTFFSSSDCVNAVNHPAASHFQDVLRNKNPVKDPSGNFTIPMEKGNLPSQKTPTLAQWTYLNSRHVDVNTWQSPLLNPDRYAKKRMEWNSDPSSEAWMMWLTAINIQQAIWSLHRQSEDYQQLTQEDRYFVDAVGAAVKLIRKSVVQHLRKRGVDLADPESQSKLEDLTCLVLHTRLEKAKKHLETLPDDFRGKLFSYLRQGIKQS